MEDIKNVVSTQKETLTLLGHIERIIELSEKSELNDIFYEKAGEHIDAVCKILNLNAIQAILFSHLVDRSNDGYICMSEIAEKIRIRTVRLIQYQNDIEELEKRRMIRCCCDKRSVTYRVPREVVEALRQNKAYQHIRRKDITAKDFFYCLDQLFEELNNNELGYHLFVNETDILCEDNPHLQFTQQLKKAELSSEDRVLLLRFCNLFVENEDDNVQFSDFKNVIPWHYFRSLKSTLQDKSNALFKKGLIECNNDNGFEDRESFRLTDMAKTELLGELNLQTKKVAKKKDVLEHSSLAVKQMYYNEKEQKQVEQLTGLLCEENFVNVQNRLKDKGMRAGFACLFYGAPGTGKTETVYQIARQTGRNIFLVDISETKSCWFGESEKKIKEVFEKYKSLVKSENITPILLFNEADAVIGKRKDVTSGSVAQTENAIQNIILQEMENLDGIMIATTNLTQNLDKAFERRFLYKIEFEKPGAEAKRHIWQSIIPALQDGDAAELSRTFDFSGGQIENIARKCTVDSIILGAEPNFEILVFHCQNEMLAKSRKSIGFNVN